MKTETHILRIGAKEIVLRFTDRRPNDVPLVEFPQETGLRFTKKEVEDINRWLHLTFDKYCPYICRVPDGSERMAVQSVQPLA